MWVTIFLLYLTAVGSITAKECHKRDYGNGKHVCVCTAQYCDTVPSPVQVPQPQSLIYTSNKSGLRFVKSSGTFTKSGKHSNNEIVINSTEQYQRILGWGGAFTDSTGINLNSLGKEAQDKLLKSYFGDSGIEYNLCRVPMGGTDFSLRAYSYADGEADATLSHFRLAPEDSQYKIPYIKKAQELSQKELQLFTSAWTAPKWMKTNKKYYGFGFLREDMYQAWAEYFVKFFDAYAKEGIKFWGVTTGNEPSLVISPIKVSTVGWIPTAMATWIRHNLGPTIRNSNHSDLKIMILDDQRNFLARFANTVLKDKSTRNYVDGIAVHWYTDQIVAASLLTETHYKFPEMFILASEASYVTRFRHKHVDLGSWVRGEGYANDIIEDLMNWVDGWVDWNMALNLQGGPTYVSNFVDSPIIVNATAGEFYKQPMYYCLGHFSKFVPRGSVRIASSYFDAQVPAVAFRRPDNGTVVVILNKRDEVVPVTIFDNSKGVSQLELSKKSISTILYW